MPTLFVRMSKRCAIGYAVCQSCGDKAKASGEIVTPDRAYTTADVERITSHGKQFPPTCSQCGAEVAIEMAG
jgi:hypothetical protein